MDGVLLIDKPAGWSSFDAIRQLRKRFVAENEERITDNGNTATDTHKTLSPGFRTSDSDLRPPKFGHAGTLDPMATGLLIILVGKATKKQDQFMKQDKHYEAEITFGATSTTDDAEGVISDTQHATRNTQPDSEEIESVLERFTGEIEQVPPQYSAVKVEGKRSYKTARSGGSTELKARNVTIHSLELVEYAYPVLRVSCYVSSGTYIRSLARDIGEELGVGGYLSGLRRTEIGEYSVENAISPEKSREKLEAGLLSIEKLIGNESQ